MRGINGRSKRQFLQLFTNVKRSTAYYGLSPYARSLLFELIDRYNGCNNGMIGLGVREAAYELGCCNGTVSNAFSQVVTFIGLFRRLAMDPAVATADAPPTSLNGE